MNAIRISPEPHLICIIYFVKNSKEVKMEPTEMIA